MSPRLRSLVIAFCGAAALAIVGFAWQFLREPPAHGTSGERLGAAATHTSPTPEGRELSARVLAFCGDCHAPPHPESFPREAWEAEVERGYAFYVDSDRQDLVMPVKAEVLSYYHALAPERLLLPLPPPDPTPDAPRFSRAAALADVTAPAVSHLNWSGTDRDLMACDMRSGAVERYRVFEGQFAAERLATLRNPAHVARCDLDGDQRMDLVVADLGSFDVRDHELGRVVWLRSAEDGSIEEQVLLEGVGRVADVEPLDFDGDGDTDLIVAEFGWIKSGSLHLLENLGAGRGTDRFANQTLDRRHGTSHVPIVDLNQDGRPDFVALISQEHEVVEAFLNAGDGTFHRERLYAARDPAFGSSGLWPVDLDQDGDLDMLLTNGDTFDSFYLKPYQGIRWLENIGNWQFVEHQLLLMPGVFQSVTGDFDGDGDLDIAAAAFVPQNLLTNVSDRRLDSIVWLEQTVPGTFVRHLIEDSFCHHVTLVAGDFDDDGDLDLVTGNFDATQKSQMPACTWWRNNSPHSDRE
jgi:hypothetical protein